VSRIALTPELQHEYQRLFAACVIRPERAAEVDERVDNILVDRDRYQMVGQRLDIPSSTLAGYGQLDGAIYRTRETGNGSG
jgi:lysozyme family protein